MPDRYVSTLTNFFETSRVLLRRYDITTLPGVYLAPKYSETHASMKYEGVLDQKKLLQFLRENTSGHAIPKSSKDKKMKKQKKKKQQAKAPHGAHEEL